MLLNYMLSHVTILLQSTIIEVIVEQRLPELGKALCVNLKA